MPSPATGDSKAHARREQPKLHGPRAAPAAARVGDLAGVTHFLFPVRSKNASPPLSQSVPQLHALHQGCPWGAQDFPTVI